MGLRGNLSSIKGLKASIRALPTTLRHQISQAAAPEMTTLTRRAYDSGQSVYGDARPNSKVTGEPLTLFKTGAAAGDLKFVATGTILRCVLGQKYSRYLIGKYGILPNGSLPSSWTKKLTEVVSEAKVTL